MMQRALRRDFLQHLLAFATPPSERMAGAVGIVILMVAAAADYWTGTEHSPLLFYIVPVIYTAWLSNRSFSNIVAIIASATLAVIEVSSNVDALQRSTSSAHNAVVGLIVIWLVYLSVLQVRAKIASLCDANRKLEIANKQRERLFRIVSHDLRSPFNALLGYTELLEDALEGSSKDRIREYAGYCTAAAKAAHRLLEDLLAWATLQLDSRRESPEVVEVEPLLNQSVAAFQSSAALKGVTLLVEPIEAGLRLVADRAATATVLRNLIDNGLKFTEKGGSVLLSAKARGNVVELLVRDTGVGISCERMKMLFEYGSGRSTPGTRGEPGSGLGLPLCRELVEHNHGEVLVNSEIGRGTCFSIRLPGPASLV